MSHWQHLRSSQGSRSFKLGSSFQYGCRFNDSHRWDFPPPISTILVVGCSVRGRSHFCCGSSSTVSSFFLPSFKSNVQTRPRNHPFGLTSPCSSSLLLSNRFRLSLPVSATSALRCHSVLESSLDFYHATRVWGYPNE